MTKTNETQKWNTDGLVRTVFFDDGNTAQEELTFVDSPNYFSYKITNFTSPLRFLINQINGTWKFDYTKDVVNIVWTYQLVPKNNLCEWIIDKLILNDLKTFCQNAMNIIVSDLESRP